MYLITIYACFYYSICAQGISIYALFLCTIGIATRPKGLCTPIPLLLLLRLLCTMKMWLALAMLAQLPMAAPTGAFGSLWLVDLRNVNKGNVPMEDVPSHLLVNDERYGINDFVMVASHRSQYYYQYWAVYPQGDDDIGDVSDLYHKNQKNKRYMRFIASMTFLLFMAKIAPMLLKSILPWHEVILQSNDYPGEWGCCVTVRLPPLTTRYDMESQIGISRSISQY